MLLQIYHHNSLPLFIQNELLDCCVTHFVVYISLYEVFDCRITWWHNWLDSRIQSEPTPDFKSSILLHWTLIYLSCVTHPFQCVKSSVSVVNNMGYCCHRVVKIQTCRGPGWPCGCLLRVCLMSWQNNSFWSSGWARHTCNALCASETW